MKRILFTIFSFFIFILTVTAQPRLTSNKSFFNFGQIEWKHPVTADYVISNTGDKPLVLSNVTVSCACTDVEWTKTPIAPGESGMVKDTCFPIFAMTTFSFSAFFLLFCLYSLPIFSAEHQIR